MARLSDLKTISRSIGMRVFIQRVLDEMVKDNLFVWASALAYSWLFAFFPFFIFLLAAIPYLPEKLRVVTPVQVRSVMASEFPGCNGVLEQICGDNNVVNRRLPGPLLYLGLFLAVWAASSGTSMTMSALDRCYELDKGRSVYQQRILAILFTIFMAIMLLAVMCLLPMGTAVKAWAIKQGLDLSFGRWILFDVARWMLSLVLMVLVLTIIYYKGPAIRHHFCLITPGAAFALIVWVVLGLVFRLYVDTLGRRGFSQNYGAFGEVALLLLFFYLDALVLMVGAEINAEIDFEVLRVRRGTNDFRKCEDLSCGAPTSC